jgi:hypothetical protein
MNCFKSENVKGVRMAITITFLTQIVNVVMPMMGQEAIALPGQTSDQVVDWIRTNPALRPEIGERLLVRKSDTPSRRFQFQASVLLPGIAALRGDANLIRSEQIKFFDIINGVTRSRLEESLRSIYGPEIMRDYATAKRVYAYPTVATLGRSQGRNASEILRNLQGELRQGKKYGYWVELLQNDKGSANSGQITVFELQSLPKLEQELISKREKT